MANPGKLYLVGTPIGNLGDLSARAAEVLGAVDTIAAEDTRRTRILLDRIGVRAPMVSFHARNEHRRIPEILHRLRRGESVAVVSEAGNPGVSDPAEALVRATVEEGVPVIPVPGPSAFLAALVASGLSTRRFRFEGYLPTKAGPRRELLRRLRADEATLLVYESPRRIHRLMKEVLETLGNRRVVLAREITKLFEEFFRGTVEEAIDHLAARPPRGEFVVVLEGDRGGDRFPEDRVLEMLRDEVKGGSSLRDAVRTAARVGRWTEQEVYRLVRRKGATEEGNTSIDP